MIYITIVSDNKHVYSRNSNELGIVDVELNNSEYNILCYLLNNNSELSSRDTLLEEGWPGRVVTENSLNVAMMKLRKKIEQLGADIQIITVPSMGYQVIISNEVEVEYIERVSQLALTNDSKDVVNNDGNYLLSHTVNPSSSIDFINMHLLGRMLSSLIGFYSRAFSYAWVQFIFVLIICLFIFDYLYSSSWSTFLCTIETVCSDYLK